MLRTATTATKSEWDAACRTQEEREESLVFLQKLIETLPAYGEVERSAACFGVPLFELFASEESAFFRDHND